VFNRNTQPPMGVFQAVNSDGSIGPTQPLAAALGNQMVVSIENNQHNVSTCVVLREGTQDPYTYCQ
jgi:hypothetical protein